MIDIDRIDILIGILNDQPNIYAKWYIPAMDDALKDVGLIKESENIKTQTLMDLSEKMDKQ